MKNNKQTTMLFGYDVGQMPGYAQFGYVFATIIFFLVMFKVMTDMLFSGDTPKDVIKKRREEVLARRSRKNK